MNVEQIRALAGLPYKKDAIASVAPVIAEAKLPEAKVIREQPATLLEMNSPNCTAEFEKWWKETGDAKYGVYLNIACREAFRAGYIAGDKDAKN